MRNSKPILLIEDDLAGAMSFRKALETLKITNLLMYLTDGKQALKYLRDEGEKKPCIIFLGLNMLNNDAIEFLKVVKADNTLKKIPVVVLTKSAEKQDVLEGFRLDVASYIVKPVNYQKLLEAIRMIDLYWTSREGQICNG